MTTPHHRHPVHSHAKATSSDGNDAATLEEGPAAKSEASPLVPSKSRTSAWQHHDHLSMMDEGVDSEQKQSFNLCGKWVMRPQLLPYRKEWWMLGLLLIVGLAVWGYNGISPHLKQHPHGVVFVEDAKEYRLDLPPDKDDGTASQDENVPLQLWFRVWGRVDGTGIPLLFVHGGPGNAIADYFGNSNQRFFGSKSDPADEDPFQFMVVEVDQRGTGNSQPSIRDGWQNMKYYEDISITKMVADFEVVRKFLGIDQWLVWGGSFGSTLAIYYGELYPNSCLGLVLRGIYLDTAEEVGVVYAKETYVDNPKRLHEFNILYQYAADYANDNQHGSDKEPLDPNDAERILRLYAEMITSGDKMAAWHWFVFENNLMELDPKRILDPYHIHEKYYRESLSVAFFETRLWLHGSYEFPTSDLLDETKIQQLTMPMWICQGQRDEVCPPQYARKFLDAVVKEDRSPQVVARFLNATHEDTDPAIATCLKLSLEEFVQHG
ncbi:Proline iminopeptidase [Seminavis robusta]|uniref:Proline iminopeptidase n=1 Tax=Seminavis robusta TaxID=568900 RepID=A0A9N8HJX2_9STRA|nr:Proline iminopeptidase [Seminavis robusta]|eukprot:Sro692_g188090.1 Proline iminopeptidase (492) ;mRNA; f:31681-33156